MSRKREIVDVEAELVAETDAAYRIHDGKRTVWVPKSLVERDQDAGSFAMPEWLARGLI